MINGSEHEIFSSCMFCFFFDKLSYSFFNNTLLGKVKPLKYVSLKLEISSFGWQGDLQRGHLELGTFPSSSFFESDIKISKT